MAKTKSKYMPKVGTKKFMTLLDQMNPAEIREMMPDILHNQGLQRKREFPHMYVGSLEDKVIEVPKRLRELSDEADDDA